MTHKDELEKLIDSIMPCSCIPAYKDRNLSAPDCPNCNYRDDIVQGLQNAGYIKPKVDETRAGEELFKDLCRRLIGRILTFNPAEHDIELNLCGIIEKAKLTDNSLYIRRDKVGG